VAGQLIKEAKGSLPVLYPIEIDIDNSQAYTRFRVVAQDTPAFLYSLSNALALRGISIEGVAIDTRDGKVHDQVDVLDAHGEKLEKQEQLDQIKLSVLLTKQFTYFLGQAPDPYTALSRFELMCEDVLKVQDHGQWFELLSNPKSLLGLAQILGTSDFIWEDLVRTQYESLMPMLSPHLKHKGVPFDVNSIERRLAIALEDEDSYEGKLDTLNSFKDKEIFIIDLDHILHEQSEVNALASPLTNLAEVVVRGSVTIVCEELVRRHGTPRTVGGLEARYAVMGLGKFGGEALGYASDIELLFVYSDNGDTDGEDQISNGEFFGKLASESARVIRAKREGIFRVDMRLRPHGNSGPMACSLESFCKYYGFGGGAMSFEKLALTRLRFACGSRALGEQVERLRDEYIYEQPALDMAELRQLRERQFAEKAGSRPNAKFGPGALVDLEYYVQILQVKHGREFHPLRTPRIREALNMMSRTGILQEEEAGRLIDAYVLLRRLINGLRMLRGSALDLFLPEPDSMEYAHLARRMGYQRGAGLSPEKELSVAFDTHTAVIRVFIERHFGRESLPDPAHGNVVDLVLSDDPPAELYERVLSKVGFREPDRALSNIRRLAGETSRRDRFARIAVLAMDALRMGPDPDMALNNWERFVAALKNSEEHYDMLLSQPRRLEILLAIFAASQFLADTLVRNPDFLEWATNPESLQRVRKPENLNRDLLAFTRGTDELGFINAIRKFRRREFLRIGTRDICLQAPIEEVVADLSLAADGILDAALTRVLHDMFANDAEKEGAPFCVMAMGKLGGKELNYSSDIDLLGVYDDTACTEESEETQRKKYAQVMERLSSMLTKHTEEGYVYRVDLRLRPHGGAGALVPAVGSVTKYYESGAAFWELQAVLKMRPMAGNLEVGESLLARLRPIVANRAAETDVPKEIQHMRAKAMSLLGENEERDLKTGSGGIRDVEFLVQGLQLMHLEGHAELFEGNTIRALYLLRKAEILSRDDARALRKDYSFLRRVEHFLQILEDRQTHLLPEHEKEQEILARRLFGAGATAHTLVSKITEVRHRIHTAFESGLVSKE